MLSTTKEIHLSPFFLFIQSEMNNTVQCATPQKWVKSEMLFFLTIYTYFSRLLHFAVNFFHPHSHALCHAAGQTDSFSQINRTTTIY